MVIDKIGNINNITETKKNKPVSGKNEASRGDSIHISSEGKQAAETARNIQIIKETPDIRADRVKEIKAKIDNGTYDFDNKQILEMVADKIASFLLR
ncbi:MAG: flagellar biosynthesis anti-sigma factor FlgM [Spirochaetota bacterium]